MKKPSIFVTALLAGGLILTGCATNRTPATTNTASADDAATTNNTRVVGNSAGSIQANQLEAERVGSGTMSGSTVSSASNPGVSVPLNTGNTGQTTAVSGQPTQTTTSGATTDLGTTSGQVSGGNTGSTMGTNSSVSGSSSATSTDERSGSNAGNPASVSQTPTTPSPAPAARSVDDTQRMRMANRRAPEQNAPAQGGQQPNSTSSPTTTAPPNSVQDRERTGRDATNPAGMEQRQASRAGMTDYGSPEDRTMPPMVSNQAEAIDRLTTRLDEIDATLGTKMSARRKASLLRERKTLMNRLGTLKAVEIPATPNQVPTRPGGQP